MSDDTGYPATGNILGHWHRTQSAGKGLIRVPGLAPISVTWSGYRFHEGSYLTSYFGEQFVGVFERSGRRLVMTERYVDTSITNSGRRVRRWTHESADGVCMTEIVHALEAGRRLELEREYTCGRSFVWSLNLGRTRDHTFHEIELEHFQCRARFVLRAGRGVLERSRHRDAST